MSVIHVIQCNACEATAPLLPTAMLGVVVWMNPHGWVDLGRNRHACTRPGCLKELANGEAAIPTRRLAGEQKAEVGA